MARECSRPPKRTSFFGALAAVKQARTFGVARSESREAFRRGRPGSFPHRSKRSAVLAAERSSPSPSRHRIEEWLALDERAYVLGRSDRHASAGPFGRGCDVRKKHGIFESEQSR